MDPFREVPGLREKWDFWRKHKDEFDTVFIGTSRTFRGINPARFDELTKAAGKPTHSFNFGVDAMLPPEDAYVADYILRDPPKNLRWVFLELGMFLEDFEETLNKFSVPAAEQAELKAIVNSTRVDIVTGEAAGASS